MVKCDNRSFDGDSSLSKPHQGKYLNKIWDFLILRFSFWMLLMQIEFHAFPSVLSWFHGASFKPLFAAIEEAFPSHFFRFFHHLIASSPQAWQFSPSWLCFVVLVFFKIPYNTDLRSGSVIFKTFYLSITVSRATITVFPAVTKTMHSFNKLLSSTLRQTGFYFLIWILWFMPEFLGITKQLSSWAFSSYPYQMCFYSCCSLFSLFLHSCMSCGSYSSIICKGSFWIWLHLDWRLSFSVFVPYNWTTYKWYICGGTSVVRTQWGLSDYGIKLEWRALIGCWHTDVEHSGVSQ